MRIPFISPRRPVVAVLRLAGVIQADALGMGRGLSLARVAEPLRRLKSRKGLAALALSINSPGGSPVQSRQIAEAVRRAAARAKVPVLAFCEDVAASGGYWLACAGDEILADPASIVGSIGVITGGFGLDRAIARLGVDRRLYTAGARKGMLDPFQPEKAEEVAHLKALQAELHGQFIAWVKERRGPKLTGADDDLFSGAFWTGAEAARLGLIDGLGALRPVCEARFGEDVRIELLNPPRRGLALRLGGARHAADLPAGLLDAVESRAAWARFGL